MRIHTKCKKTSKMFVQVSYNNYSLNICLVNSWKMLEKLYFSMCLAFFAWFYNSKISDYTLNSVYYACFRPGWMDLYPHGEISALTRLGVSPPSIPKNKKGVLRSVTVKTIHTASYCPQRVKTVPLLPKDSITALTMV